MNIVVSRAYCQGPHVVIAGGDSAIRRTRRRARRMGHRVKPGGRPRRRPPGADIEAGNARFRAMVHVVGATAAGLVLAARVPNNLNYSTKIYPVASGATNILFRG
jgi:hypothetical protein